MLLEITVQVWERHIKVAGINLFLIFYLQRQYRYMYKQTMHKPAHIRVGFTIIYLIRVYRH
jgi:hypothetical protein